MKLSQQVFTATLPDADSGAISGSSYAEVLLSNGMWTGVATINNPAVGFHDTTKAAQAALAKALRALAEKVEGDA